MNTLPPASSWPAGAPAQAVHTAGAATAPRPRFAFLRATFLLVVAAGLTWAVITRSIGAYLAEVDPGKALVLDPKQAHARLYLADRALQAIAAEQAKIATPPAADEPDRVAAFARIAKDAARTVAQPEKPAADSTAKPAQPAEPVEPAKADESRLGWIRRYAQMALLQEPLNARAIRILGQVADSENDKDTAARLMAMAARTSVRETYAAYWMLQRSYEMKDLKGAVGYADKVLRTRSQMLKHVMPFLVRIAESKQGASELKTALLANPPWRTPFLRALPAVMNDTRAPLDLLLALKDTDEPPSSEELKGYIDALLARNQQELAYYTWLQFLPPEQLGSIGLLFNGSFEMQPTQLAFDWQMPPGAGVSLQVAVRPDRTGERALRVVFGQGRADFRGVRQTTMLGPGSYRLEGSYMGELAGRRGLIWRVTCDGATRPAGVSSAFIGATPAWTGFNLTFSVPPTGCRSQRLELVHDARSESEKLLAGTAWYDELRITRLVEPDKRQ